MNLLSLLTLEKKYSEEILAAIQKAANCTKEKDEKYLYFIYPDTLEHEEQFMLYKETLKAVAQDLQRKLFEITIPSNQDVFTLLEPLVDLLGIKSVEELHLPILLAYDPEQEDGLFDASRVWKVK